MTRDEMEADLRVHGFVPCVARRGTRIQGWVNPTHPFGTVIGAELRPYTDTQVPTYINRPIQWTTDLLRLTAQCRLLFDNFKAVYDHIVRERYL